MDEQLKKRLESDDNGLLTYEYIANNINSANFSKEIDLLVDNIIRVHPAERVLPHHQGHPR